MEHWFGIFKYIPNFPFNSIIEESIRLILPASTTNRTDENNDINDFMATILETDGVVNYSGGYLLEHL